jgi:hypothetical protein
MREGRYLSRPSRQHPWFSACAADGNVPAVRRPLRSCAAALLITCALTAAMAASAGAAAPKIFHPRLGAAFGAEPPGGQVEIATGANLPVVYHGGVVMRDVTIHTIFWAPPGFQFDGAPSLLLTKGYEALIQQFFTDAAHDSGSTGNLFSILSQYGDSSGPGSYDLHYSVGADSIDDADPYPPKNKQCASPAGVETCVTDLEVQQEVDKIATAQDPTGRGLHDIWFVFLPPNVDECTSAGICGTNAFAGYHSMGNLGSGPTVYVAVPSPLIEFTPPPGFDPEGNPEAETTLDTAAHETVEAITDPYGTGWMDPNGFEVADDCENPEDGTPLGYGLDSSPYNEVINNHEYLIQMMWSNTDLGCVQHSTVTTDALPLAQVNLTQFRRTLTGNIGTAHGGIAVEAAIVRSGIPVSIGGTHTRADGSWKLALSHAVGDDRDLVVVRYGKGGPKPDAVETGSGGNPFTESGWTGWFDLDHGYAVGSKGVILSPCGQTGVLSLTVGGAVQAPPVEQCQTESDVTVTHTKAIGAKTAITMSSTDDRAVSSQNPNGALVKLSIRLGEPGARAATGNSQIIVAPSGFPLCSAHLEAQSVSCDGLVPGAHYTIAGHRARADFTGSIGVAARVKGGDALALKNSAHRTLTTLHVAHLRVAVTGEQDVLSGGICQPGDYYGPGLRHPPTGPAVDHDGATGTGVICPPSGHAKGLPAFGIEQTDDSSGGTTQTVIPDFESLTPDNGGTVYGAFTAAAQTAKFGSNFSVVGAPATVSLTITRVGAHHRAFFAHNVATASGVAVHRLARGIYNATWVLTDANGDTRTAHTRFVEAK